MSYVSEASELFLSLNTDLPFLDPLDYLSIAEWEKQEIPLPLVLDAIREFSIKAEIDGNDRFSHLSLEVKLNYAAWLKETGSGHSRGIRDFPVHCQSYT